MKTGHFTKGAIWLKVNDTTKQSSDLSKMIWSVAEQIANLSQFYELAPGDIMDAHIDGIYDIRAKVV